MSKIAIEGNALGSGTLTIAAPNTSTNRTLTLPDNTGTIITTGSTFAGTGPAFSAYAGTTTGVSSNTWTKIAMNTETIDTNSCYDTGTYRFTPNVAGYYHIEAGVASAADSGFAGGIVSIYKNGAGQRYSEKMGGTNNIDWARTSGLIYLNGTTDYVEAYANVVGSSNPYYFTSVTLTFFEGFLARAA